MDRQGDWMAVRIRLRDGSEVLVQATLEQWQEAIRVATAKREPLEIERPDGNLIAVNPQEIQYSREDPQAAEDLARHFHAAAAG
jgi:hypothetical protein